jgi:hypothetical protein
MVEQKNDGNKLEKKLDFHQKSKMGKKRISLGRKQNSAWIG